MDGFKPTVKMKCGGSVSKAAEKAKMKTGGKVESADIKEDKKIVKRAMGMHDDQMHEGRTDLSGLKKGGRCKKTGGTVRKYAAGGLIEAKGKKGRPTTPPGGVEPDDVPRAPEAAYKKGGKVKKMAIGGLTDPALQTVLNADALRKRRAAMAPTPGGMSAPAVAPTAPVAQPAPQDMGASAGLGVQPGGTTMKCGGRTRKK